jgi:parallel beta-helix repeat protein
MSTVSITQSSVRNFDGDGIRSNSTTTPPSLTVNINGNLVVISNSPTLYSSAQAIDIDGGIGNVSGNSVFGPLTNVGIGAGGTSGLTFANNTVDGVGIGIWVGSSNTVESNRVSGAFNGATLSGDDNVVKENSFMNIPLGAAISFNGTGTSNSVMYNVINDSFQGIAGDPGGNLVTSNSFSNVSTIIP